MTSKIVFTLGRGLRLGAAAIAVTGAAAALPATAEAQVLQDGVVGYYGGVGAYLGGACCGPAGVVIGGTAGAMTGGLVYGAQSQFWSHPPALPQYTPVYPSRQWGIAGSTPMMMRRR